MKTTKLSDEKEIIRHNILGIILEELALLQAN